jgi:CRISPR/Cas system CSM-associated protein Csm3 (group 7 of RAMP superfamily)
VPARNLVEIRDHVGIARDFGAAAPKIKFDRAILPRGTVLNLEMIWELPADGRRAALAQEMLFASLAALRRGEIRLGAAKSRGLGHVSLDGDPAIRRQEFLSREGMLAVLRKDRRRVPFSPSPADRRSSRIEIDVEWRPLGPVMVKSGYDGVAVDALPLVTGANDRVSPVLPGSALKGALRSQAERILRTVLAIDAPDGDDQRSSFLNQLSDPRLSLALQLFGVPGQRKADGDRRGDTGQTLPGAAALLVDDVTLRNPLPRPDWEAIENAPKTQSIYAVKTGGSGVAFEPTFHAAVDRWTGGAAEHLLFSTLEPHPEGNVSPWGPMRLTLLPKRLPEDSRRAAVALLLLTLRDLARGLIPIGYAGNRGMGAIKVDTLTYRGSGSLPEPFSALAAEIRDSGSWENLPGGVVDDLHQAWLAFVSENRGGGDDRTLPA